MKSVLALLGHRLHIRSAVLAFALLAYVAGGVTIMVGRSDAPRFAQVDFNAYYAAASLFQSGHSIYDSARAESLARSTGFEYIHSRDYLYPPYLAVALSPVTKVDPFVLGFAWYLLNLAALGLAIWFIVQSGYQPTTVASPAQQWRDYTLFALLFIPTAYSFYVGQINALLLLLLSGIFRFAEKRRDIVTGTLLGIATLTKVAPALMLLYLLFQRKRRAIACAIGVCAVVGAGTASWLSPHLQSYLNGTLPSFSFPEPHPVNQSLNGFFSRLFTDSIFFVPLYDSHVLSRVTTLLATFIVLGVVLKQLWSLRNADLSAGRDTIFGMLICAMVIIAPLAWESFYLVLLFPLITMGRRWPVLSRPQRCLFVMSVLLIDLQRAWDPFVNSPFDYPHLRSLSPLVSLGLYGALALFWVSILALRDAVRASQPTGSDQPIADNPVAIAP